MGAFKGNNKLKIFGGSTKVKKAYLGDTKIYSSGNIVTYVVDSGMTYLEEVDEGASILAPATFVPAKSGWTFLGWRKDTTALSSVLSSEVMGDEPVTLYAVFAQSVALTYYDGSTTAKSKSGTRYYNNGNISNPGFTMSQATKSGWIARGWAAGTAGNASVAYSNGAVITISANTTIYGLYYKTCTLTAKSYNSTQTATGTAYYNSAGNTSNATCTVPSGASYSGWSWRGWGTSTGATASVSYANGATYTLGTGDATIYGLYSQTIYLYYNGNSATSGAVSTQSGTRYYNAYGNYSNPTFTLASNGYSRTNYRFTGWNLGAVGATVTLSVSTTAYAQWVQTVTNFDYNGGVQTFIAPVAGTYKLEVWGAEGQIAYTWNANGVGTPGKGGYSYGNVSLSKGQVLYVVVGSQATISALGYNGGGSPHGGYYTYNGGGGGATHIAKSNNRGVLANYASYTSEVLIVAGGGGGCGYDGSGESSGGLNAGSGGGNTGDAGTGSAYYDCGDTWRYSITQAQGGTQSGGGTGAISECGSHDCDDIGGWTGDSSWNAGAGSFGKGGSGYFIGYRGSGGGGGGGWYGGGGGLNGGGAGGSGYIGGVSSGSMSSGVRSGNGYATITLL